MSEKAQPLTEADELSLKHHLSHVGEPTLEDVARLFATLDAARERIAELEADTRLVTLRQERARAEAAEARERKLVEALREAHGALALAHRGLVNGHVKAKAIIPREGPITSLEARVAQAMLAIAPHLSPTPDMPSDCHPQGE